MAVSPKVTRGHSVTLNVTVSGRSQLAAITEAIEALRSQGVPLEAEWQMSFHRGKERNGADPFMEADYISVDATWAEQT